MFPYSLTVNLPAEIISQLSGTCQYLLHLINQLCHSQSKKSPSRSWYCFPSEYWLGKRVSRCREQVSRSVQKLSELELLDVTHRRQVNGRFQTNLYRLGKQLLYYLNQAKSLKNRISYRVTQMSQIVSNTMLDKNHKGLKQHLSNQVRGPTWSEIASRIEEKMFGKEK